MSMFGEPASFFIATLCAAYAVSASINSSMIYSSSRVSLMPSRNIIDFGLF